VDLLSEEKKGLYGSELGRTPLGGKELVLKGWFEPCVTTPLLDIKDDSYVAFDAMKGRGAVRYGSLEVSVNKPGFE
jgi:hypothetical protein